LHVGVALYISSYANAVSEPTELPTFSSDDSCKIINGEVCCDVVVVDPYGCLPGGDHQDPEGMVCANDGAADEAYCSYDVFYNACARCAATPTSAPTDPDVTGDPHFRTWSGESYDFHGVCDLVLLKNEQFDEGLGMDIHIRSKRMNEKFSYVDSASVRIGDNTLEVRGGKEDGLWMNSEQVVDIDNDKEAFVLSDKFPVAIEKLSEKSKEVRINLGGAEAIVIRTWNKMVRVSISHATNENFGTSLGMMGAFSTGAKLGRDGITNIEDFNIFGQEWQVLPTEAKLFHEIGDAVQSPAQCEIPSSSQMRRRLSKASVTVEEAKIACDGVAPADLDLCMFDVMASNDKNLAGAY
jgi:hypothetical protein